MLKHPERIFRDVIIPEAQFGDATLLQPDAAPLIARALAPFGMLPAIEFDGQAQLNPAVDLSKLEDVFVVTGRK